MTGTEPESSLRTVLGELWRAAPEGTRRLAQVMWSVGTVLVAATMVVDHFVVWQQRPFLTNILSNIIGAIFAVPFALLFLGGFSTYQAERSISRRIDVKVGAAKAGLRSVLIPLQRPALDRTGDIRAAMNELWEYGTKSSGPHDIDAVIGALRQLAEFADLTELEVFEHDVAQVRTHLEMLREALTDRVGNDGSWHRLDGLLQTTGDLDAVVRAHRRHLERGAKAFPTNGRARAMVTVTDARLDIWREAARELMISSHRFAEMLDRLADLCAAEDAPVSRSTD